MSKKKKKRSNKIEGLDLMKGLRITIPLKPTKAFASKKSYNRKDKSWKKEIY